MIIAEEEKKWNVLFPRHRCLSYSDNSMLLFLMARFITSADGTLVNGQLLLHM